MKYLIVFTQTSSLNAFSKFGDNRPDLRILDGESQIILLRFSEPDNIFEPVSCIDEPGLYFIYDEIKEYDFFKLISHIPKNDISILKHSYPKYKLLGFYSTLTGTHEKKENNGNYYHTLIDILESSGVEKVNDIREGLFAIDTTLEELLKPFERSSPYEIISKEGINLKQAQEKLQAYVDGILKLNP